jgi:galactonate dehydratase
VQEQVLFRDEYLDLDWQSYLKNPDVIAHDDGYVEPPEAPGLGLEIDEATVRERTEEEFTYDRGIERLPDGSITGS